MRDTSGFIPRPRNGFDESLARAERDGHASAMDRLDPAPRPARKPAALPSRNPLDAIDAAIMSASWVNEDSPRLHKPKPRKVGTFAWGWKVLSERVSPAAEVASGWAFTEKRAVRRQQKAYEAALDRFLADRQAQREAAQRVAEADGCE